MPRKLTDDVRQVILILKLRGKLKDWKLVPIDNKTEQEVAEIMKQSTFFLSFNHREGFGLPPVEAMACGCYVVGYHGQGGKEYFKPEFSSLVEGGDIIAYVKKVEELLSTYEKSPETIIEKGKKASEYILSHYTMDKEEEDTIKIWNDILDH
jgi:glycosyltransferase, group 1 family